MPNKPVPAANSKIKSRLIGGLKAFSASLSEQAVIDALAGAFIIAVLSLLLLRDYQRPRVEQLPAGNVEDPAEPNLLRDQAGASVLPVFDFNTKPPRDAMASLEQMFAAGRTLPA